MRILLPSPALPLLLLPLTALAQTGAPPAVHVHLHDRAWCGNVVLPQTRSFRVDPAAPEVRVTSVSARIALVDGIAATILDVHLANASDTPTEAELLLPVPDGAVVSGFDFEGKGSGASAELLPRERAVAAYESIVAQLKDPALLEFAGSALVRSSVFPVPAGGTQTVRIKYEHVMPAEGGRLDYVLPRSEALAVDVPWNVEVEVRSTRPIADVYSPTHDLPRVSGDAHRVKLHARPGRPMEAGPLRLSVLLAEGPVSTTLFTSADEDGTGGWFLLLAGLGELRSDVKLPPREVTLVLDRSGSMGGEKFDQAIAAARQIIEGLAFGEAVQIIDYSSDVERFAASAVVKTKETLPRLRAYLDGLQATGGTNLDGALAAALGAPALEGFMPVVLFLTDGLPTEGEVREHVIRERALSANVHSRRVFTFGVGNDVNAPLLDAIAVGSRARTSYIRPGEDVELAVAEVFESLNGPVVTDLDFAVLDEQGAAHPRLLRDVYPKALPDLFRNDRLLLVGRYTSAEVGRLALSGKHAGVAASWELNYDFARALPRNEFVRRLWAMRRIAGLEDELRQAGADPNALASLKDDPRFGELAGELLALATRFGILTDSTAFLALEGTTLGNGMDLLAEVCDNGLGNASRRSGIDGVAAQQNVDINRAQTWVNGANCLYNPAGELVANPTVQSMQGRTFFRRGNRWVEGSLALDEAVSRPTRTIVFGSPEHSALVQRLEADGCSGVLSLPGEILIRDGAETVLIEEPPASPMDC